MSPDKYPTQDSTAAPEACSPNDTDETKLFVARLSPHRALTRKHFYLLMMAFSATSFISTLPFVLLGAWPIAGFMGLDVLLFYLAFRSNFRAARAHEDICLTYFELLIAKVSAKGKRAEWRFNPVWVRIDREEHAEFGTQSVALVAQGRRLEIAGFLGPDEKAALAGKLSRALAEAKRGPRFS